MLSKSSQETFLTIVILVSSVFIQLSFYHIHASSPILKRVNRKEDDHKNSNQKYTTTSSSASSRRVLSTNLKDGGSIEKRASPFGQIEKVFVDTLKQEDVEFGRKLPVIVAEQLSYDYVVVEPPPVEEKIIVGYKGTKGKLGKLRGHGCSSSSSSSSRSKGKGKRKHSSSKGKGKGKGKSSKSSSSEDYYEKEEPKIIVEEITTYYGSGGGSIPKPCKYGDPTKPCHTFSGPQDDDLY